MDEKRIKEIIESKGVIEVTYNNNPVWLENLSTNNDGKVMVKNLSTNEHFSVDIANLKE